MPNGQVQLPGANVLAVIMAAPTDIVNLATRHLTETMGVFNAGVQRLGVELTKPPTLPTGLPLLPFPGFPGAMAQREIPPREIPAPQPAYVPLPVKRATVER